MPIMFLFIFNSYSSGLSYYYFIATLITILQTWIIRRFVNDEKLLKQIELAKTNQLKNPVSKNVWKICSVCSQKRLKEQQKKVVKENN